MTSSISLLTVLGGTTTDPATATEAEDPALFAAALVSALLQLQPPIKLVTPVALVVVEAEAGDGEVAEGDVPSEGKVAPETIGQLLDTAKRATSAETTDTAQPTIAGEAEPATPKPTVDVESDQTARPAGAGPRSETQCDTKSAKAAVPRRTQAMPEATPVIASELAQPSKQPMAKPEPGAEADEVEVPAASAAEPLPGGEPSSCSGRTKAPKATDDAQPTRGKVRTASRGEVLVGDWSPAPAAFTGWKAPIEQVKGEAPKRAGNQEDAATDSQPSQPAPVQAPAPTQVIMPQLPVVPSPVVSQPVPAEDPRKSVPVASAPMTDQSVDLDSPNDSVRQVQVANARLAAQLAELVGDRDVTDFQVHLGKGKRAPDPTGTPVLELPAEAPTLPAAQPVAKAPLASKGERPDQPVAVPPRPAQTDAPVRIARQSVTTNRLMDLTEGPSIAEPLRAAAAAAGPIVPALRKEIPAPSQSEKQSEPLQPGRARPRDDSPSEPPAAASGVSQSPSESLTSRSEPDAARGTREARNLPQEGSGDDRPAGSADRVTVQVSDSEGRQTRIRVSVLGDQVRAVIVPPDSESARQLEQRMDDLQTALARQGFASSKVLVQQAGENAVERNGASLAGMAGGGEGKAASPGKDPPAGDQRQGRGQREQQHPGDGHRHPNGRSRDQGAEHRRRFTDV